MGYFYTRILTFDENGKPESIIINPLSACHWIDTDNMEAPSPTCESKDCPRKCPFNDWKKEQKILDEYKERLAKYLSTISKEIYGIESNIPVSEWV